MNGLGQNTERAGPFGREQLRDLPAVRIIPYDYLAVFELTGRPGNLIQDVVNISAEGVFVAVSIGYGFNEERAQTLGLEFPPEKKLSDIRLGDLPPDALVEGFRLNPDFRAVATEKKNGQETLKETLPLESVPGILQRVSSAQNFGFLLSIVDTATGRELQNEPVHSVATLGRADGRRPFKMLTQPMVFMPRSTIRLQIEERIEGAKGRLFIALQGYKVLGVAGNPEEAVRRLGEFDPLRNIPVYDYETGSYRSLGEAIQHDIPTTNVVPFDYVSTLELKGKPGNLVTDEVPVNVDGRYATLALGYGLDPVDQVVAVLDREEKEPEKRWTPGDLKDIALTQFNPPEALFDGIRIDPLRVRFAFSGGTLASVPPEMVSRLFQTLNQPGEVRFLFSITDTGTGRDLQNRREYNVAGLGIANGERPFRVLHKPMLFLPRSTIRVQVEEIFGRGRLFLVFQGYKILGVSGQAMAGG